MIFRDANTGAGQDCTDLAAAVQLRLRVALDCKQCRLQGCGGARHRGGRALALLDNMHGVLDWKLFVPA